jgi:hypothetical protein
LRCIIHSLAQRDDTAIVITYKKVILFNSNISDVCGKKMSGVVKNNIIKSGEINLENIRC